MARRKVEQPTVTIRMVHEELIQSYNWNPDRTFAVASQQQIIAAAAKLGVECADAWTPTLTVEQARAVLHAIVSQGDPEDRALAREAAERDEERSTPQLRAPELVKFFGTGVYQHGAPDVYAYGPGENPYPPGVQERVEAIQMSAMNSGVPL